ncbi:hypothetical protein C8F01DRAFT_1360678 [Mycena amicta]|nr:hypothetical protein C8F01DRAFT_1360678 [Mycena amicta]
MSEERNVEARLLSLLSWTVRGLLIDRSDTSFDSNSTTETIIATIPSHILIGLRDTAELSPNIEHSRLAQLALSISDEQADDTSFEPLAAEICASVYDLVVGSSNSSSSKTQHTTWNSVVTRRRPIRRLISLLEEIQQFYRRHSLTSASKDFSLEVDEFRRRLEAVMLKDEEEQTFNASSTALQAQTMGEDSSRHFPSIAPTPLPAAAAFRHSYTQPSPRARDAPIVDPNRESTSRISINFVYHLILLRLPSTYAALAADCLDQNHSQSNLIYPVDSVSEVAFGRTIDPEFDGDGAVLAWTAFIGILLGQWKTLGLLSTLIFGATLTMFQIPTIINNAPLRVVVHASLLCVLMSLVYTALFSVYFGSFVPVSAHTSRRRRWAQEMRNAAIDTTPAHGRFWSIWVLVSLPLVWTCWGIILFIVSMILFVWPPQFAGSKNVNSDETASDSESLGVRMVLSVMVLMGVVHLVLAILHLRRVGHRDSQDDGGLGDQRRGTLTFV